MLGPAFPLRRGLCYNSMMKWPRWYPTRADILSGLFVLAILGLSALAMTRRQGENVRFGPGWNCTAIPQSEPICIKNVSR
jgi:hypothetical protein